MHDWTKLKDRKLLHLGGSPCDSLGQGIDLEPLPPWAQAVCDEFVGRGVFPPEAPPNHILLNDYRPGQGIAAHKDGPLYDSRVAVLSLGSHATFQFLSTGPERTLAASLLIPPRGLLIFRECGPGGIGDAAVWRGGARHTLCDLRPAQGG